MKSGKIVLAVLAAGIMSVSGAAVTEGADIARQTNGQELRTLAAQPQGKADKNERKILRKKNKEEEKRLDRQRKEEEKRLERQQKEEEKRLERQQKEEEKRLKRKQKEESRHQDRR